MMLWNRKVLMMSGLMIAGTLGSSSVLAGFLSSTMGLRTADGNTYLSFPTQGGLGGLQHDLQNSDWERFRIRAKHDNAHFPDVGWASDEFDPVDGSIRLCATSDCHAPEIFVGLEQLDWSDDSSFSITLEAKTCELCVWQSFEVQGVLH